MMGVTRERIYRYSPCNASEKGTKRSPMIGEIKKADMLQILSRENPKHIGMIYRLVTTLQKATYSVRYQLTLVLV